MSAGESKPRPPNIWYSVITPIAALVISVMVIVLVLVL